MAKKRPPASKSKIAAKIAKVKRDHPEKTNKQAVGMAYGILRGKRGRRKK